MTPETGSPHLTSSALGADLPPDLDGLSAREILITFRDIDACVGARPWLVALRCRGVAVEAGVDFREGAAREPKVWSLEPVLRDGVGVVWARTSAAGHALVDQRQILRWDGMRWGAVSDPEEQRSLRLRLSYGKSGRLFICRGAVQERKAEKAGLSGLDVIVRLACPAHGVSHAIRFAGSALQGADFPRGREAEAAYLVNWAGESLWAPFAPSELFYEGIALRPVS